MANPRIPAVEDVVLASSVAVAGMIAHNVLEFGPGFIGSAETLIPVATFVLLALLAWIRPSNIVVNVCLFAWALLNLFGGGIVSVLPVGLFPFEPEQSLGHYGAHVIYAVAQLPLVIVATRALHQRSRRAAVETAR